MNVELKRSGNGSGNVGAVAGYANMGSGGSIKINIPTFPNVNNLAIDGVTVTANVSGVTSGGALSIGGALGGSLSSAIRDVIVSGGGVSFGRTHITSGTFIGGVAGSAVDSNMENCSFAGDVIGTIDDLNKIYLQLGGLIGRYETNSGDVYINNCLVRGNIIIDEDIYSGKKFDNGINIGGVLGVSDYKAGKVNITNCFFEEGNITATCSSGSIQAGGFCGTFYEGGNNLTDSSHYINNCGVKAGTVTIDVRNYGRYITVGGFTSTIWLKGNTSNCFSRANVISRGKGNNDEEKGISLEGDDPYTYTHQTGGFAGGLAPGSTITSCYATGTVQAMHSGNRDLSAGGLVGGSGGIINNCYALGNVLADKTAGNNTDYNTNAGGLVGSTYSGEIRYSFSAGQVIAQSKESNAYAGGVIGNLYETDISNTAALGAGVTALSDDSKFTGRVYFAWVPGAVANNYALNTMVIEEDTYNNIKPSTRPAEPDLNGSDGQNAPSSAFLSQPFWTGTLKFNFDDEQNKYVDNWDFSRIAGGGYPSLAWER